MPELPEVETIKETLKKSLIDKVIIDVNIRYDNIIATDINDFYKIKNQKIIDIKRRGKWLLFELEDYYLLSHLRMEGKYYIKNNDDEITPHQHVIFFLNNGKQLRYNDTRKFGRMYLLNKDNIYNVLPLSNLGLEPWDTDLTDKYLLSKFKNKKLPIKTVLLDQSIISGIGNIYDDEILFLSGINPYKKANELNIKELNDIIKYTKEVLENAISLGGSTIKSYAYEEGHYGKFQDRLLVHTKKKCPKCGSLIVKEKIGGRGTYYCKICQK